MIVARKSYVVVSIVCERNILVVPNSFLMVPNSAGKKLICVLSRSSSFLLYLFLGFSLPAY